MMSMLREGAATGRTKPVLLLYAANNEADLAYTEELEQLKLKLDLTVKYVLSTPTASWVGDTGYIDDDYLLTHVAMPDVRKRLFFICGSTGMLDAVLTAMDRSNIAPPDHIHAENFSVYD